MSTTLSVLEVDELCVEFGTDEGALRAVDGVSIALAPGERVAVVGESGSGKTVTALAIMGLIEPPGRITAGDVRLDGRSLRGISEDDYRKIRGRDVAMVFQDPMTALNPALRVGPQVAEAITVHDSSVSRSVAAAARGRTARTKLGSRPLRNGRATTRTSSPEACGSGC